MLSGRCPAERGRGRGEGNPISPPQKFDPRVAVIGDLDLEAVELALQSSVRRQPGEEGVDEALAAGEGRLLPHPTDGLRRDPAKIWLAETDSTTRVVEYADGTDVRHSGGCWPNPATGLGTTWHRDFCKHTKTFSGNVAGTYATGLYYEPLAKLLGLAAWRSPQFSW